MKKVILFIFLIMAVHSITAQTEKINQKAVLDVFEKENDSFKDWYSCNNNDAFFKSDTIALYNNADYYLQDWKCTELIQLKFKTNAAFNQTSFGFNNAAKTASLSENGLFEIKITTKNDSVFIDKYSSEKLIDKFYVKELTEFPLNDKRYKSKKISLIRQHKNSLKNQ